MKSATSHSHDGESSFGCLKCSQNKIKEAMQDNSIIQMVKNHKIGSERYSCELKFRTINDSNLKKLMTNFDSANQLKGEQRSIQSEVVETLANDKIGRYYLVHDILSRCDQALKGKHESSPTKQYQKHVKTTLDNFESSVRKEIVRRKLKQNELYRSLDKDHVKRFT